METIKVAILGFGTVGQGIYNIIKEKNHQFREQLGYEVEVAKILVKMKNPPQKLLQKMQNDENYYVKLNFYDKI